MPSELDQLRLETAILRMELQRIRRELEHEYDRGRRLRRENSVRRAAAAGTAARGE